MKIFETMKSQSNSIVFILLECIQKTMITIGCTKAKILSIVKKFTSPIFHEITLVFPCPIKE